MIDTQTTLAFSVFENPGVYALLIGSGVSRAAQIPTGWEVTLDLVRRVAALQGVEEQPDWESWHRQEFGGEPNYSNLLDKIATTPDERRSILHSYIEPTPEEFAERKKVPTKAHEAIAKLVQTGYVRVIITTNFDRLIENALREAGVEPYIVRSDDDIAGSVPLIHTKCILIKVHGDYLDTRIKNTDAELAGYSPQMNALLDRIVDEHGLIVCGWSSDWDPALKAAIVRAPARRYPLFWAARGEPSSGARDLIAQRAGQVVSIQSADAFFARLLKAVETQVQMRRQNPRSLELLVASTKRFIARPEERISLDDLLLTETRRLGDSLGDTFFSASVGWTPEMFEQRVARYESLSEPLARIFGVLGRWGDGTDFDKAADTVGRLAKRGEGNGLVVLIGLQSYPSVLTFYAYALGLLKAKRYRELFRLFGYQVYDRNREDRDNLLRLLFLGSWKGWDEGAWRSIAALKQKRTPLSEHLHSLFSEWARDYCVDQAEVTLLYEEFEVLAALAFITFEATSVDELRTSRTQHGGQRGVWFPPGRVGWDEQTRRQIYSFFQNPDYKQAVLQAGFAHGKEDFLDEAFEHLNLLFRRISFL